MAVAWGLANRNLENIGAIGIDEICWRKKGSKFLTLVYQIDNNCKRLLLVGKDRTKKTLIDFFDEFGPERSSLLRFVCTDMWKPYLLAWTSSLRGLRLKANLIFCKKRGVHRFKVFCSANRCHPIISCSGFRSARKQI